MTQTEVRPQIQIEQYPEMPPIARELQAGRDFLAANGWCQGQIWDGQGRYCMVGAMRARNYSQFPTCSEHFLHEFCTEKFGKVGIFNIAGTAAFNDFIAKSKDDCLRVFDEAIASALEKGI